MSEFAKLLKQTRKGKGLTLEDLANKTGVVRSYLSKLENDKVNSKPSDELLRKLSVVLDLNLDTLTMLVGRMTKPIIEGLDLKKVELFRAIGEKKFSEKEYKTLLNRINNNDNKE